MDVRCDKAGYMVKQLAKPDDTVKVGAVLAEMNTEKCLWLCLFQQGRALECYRCLTCIVTGRSLRNMTPLIARPNETQHGYAHYT